MSLYTIESFSSLISELSEDQQTVESTGNITLAMADDIYTQLDRVSNRRLDKQCAAPPRRPTIRRPGSSSGGGMLELSDILHRASKMQAQRLSNQDYTRKPGHQLAAGRQSQSAKRTEREKVLAEIARELKLMGSLEREMETERELGHTREHVRRLVLSSIQKLHKKNTPDLHPRL
ncbi:hypothetical protein LPJ66_005783 [Kickxella alabastrina]|uniref:Uncharacterized protein n=1 Tax=Kickxella alabastrina TaxID=61397 RepID=A0ACC1IJN5_9FUNG|nr:hypothetical protein LPJ66_005783 [Kickxella alabastrina]